MIVLLQENCLITATLCKRCLKKIWMYTHLYHIKITDQTVLMITVLNDLQYT